MLQSTKFWKVMFLVLLVLMPSVGLGGCGLGGIAIGALCIPCELFIVAGIAISSIFLFDGDDDAPRNPTPPPPEPPPPAVNYFCVKITSDSECPIDGIYVSDPDDPLDEPVWVFGGPQAEPVEGHPELRKALDPHRMMWPDRPEYPEYSGIDYNCNPVWFGNELGEGDRWMMAPGWVQISIHFNNVGQTEGEGKTLDLGQQWVDYGTTFIVRWHPVTGAELIDVVP